MQILHIDSSINGANSASRELSASIVANLRQAHPEAKVDYLDLALNAPSHLTHQVLSFQEGPATTEIERQENARSEALINQFLASDVVVLGAPFYNFSVPSQLKAWLDHIAKAGRTFKYTPSGPVGLAGGKKVIAASTRGSVYSNSEAGQLMEHQESYLKVFFAFLGINDVQFVRAEGLALSPESRSAAMQAAKREISETDFELPLAA